MSKDVQKNESHSFPPHMNFSDFLVRKLQVVR